MGKLINMTQNSFSVIPNTVFKDARLDYRTKGLLCQLVSLPNGWNFSVAGLVELVNSTDEKGEGKDAINTSLRKLEKYGYLKRQQTKDYKGAFAGYDYIIKIPPLAD